MHVSLLVNFDIEISRLILYYTGTLLDLQVVNLDLVKFNNLDLVKLLDHLKIHNKEEPQGESTHPYPDYSVFQVAIGCQMVRYLNPI